MAKDKSDVLQGTLDMLVLRALHLEPMHGWGITERIEQWSEHVLQLGQGSLYPALYRMEQQDFIRSEWRVTDNNRRARYYSLTARGRRYLNESERGTLEKLGDLVRRKDALDYHRALQAALKLWLFVHLPLTYGLMIFSVLHVVLVFAFSGGAR